MNTANESDKDTFYEKLQNVLDGIATRPGNTYY